MAKLLPDARMDAMLNNEIRSKITRVTVCSTQPTTYTEAITTYKLAVKTGVTSTYFTLGDGDTSGRKIAMAAINSVTVDSSGTAQHIAWVSSTGSLLLFVTTCTSQALTAGNTVNIPTHDFEIRDLA